MFYDKIWLTMREHFANTKKPRSVLTEYIVHEKVRGATASLPGENGCHFRLFPSFPTPWYHSALYLRAE